MDFLIFILQSLITILSFLIFIRVIFSWLKIRFNNFLDELIIGYTEPILSFIRNHLPSTGMIDFSPAIALLALSLLGEIINSLLVVD